MPLCRMRSMYTAIGAEAPDEPEYTFLGVARNVGRKLCIALSKSPCCAVEFRISSRVSRLRCVVGAGGCAGPKLAHALADKAATVKPRRMMGRQAHARRPINGPNLTAPNSKSG